MIRTSMSFTSQRSKDGRATDAQSAPQTAGVRAASPRTRSRKCNYDAPAGLYIREASRLRYVSFAKAALAVRHANENLSPRQLLSCAMEVDDVRFVGEEMQGLYNSPLYPLSRGTKADA
jgi:hypothetical protein